MLRPVRATGGEASGSPGARRVALVAIALLTATGAAVGAPAVDPVLLAGWADYRFIGPAGNRVSAVAGVAGDPRVYFVGAASGGIFKTTDGGAHWRPVFDDQPVASIGSLAVAPSNPQVVWAGTGETFIRSNVSMGDGIYRSTDGGETWSHRGLAGSGRIGRVVVDPRDPDVAYAAAMGHCYGPQEERGVFRTTDGGESWERVLFADPDTGASDLAMDPANPRILYAGMWQMRIRTWGRESGGPGSGLYRSRDGGDTWERLSGRGLPDPPWGKIGLAVSPAAPERVYALIETNSNRDFAPLTEHQGVLWRSDDRGGSWQLVSSDHALVQRPLYYSRAVVAPDDADEVHFLSVQHRVSLDGGVTSTPSRSGGDHHDMWIDPLAPERMIVGHDQGVSLSVNRGKSWFRPQLPIAQMYHVHTDRRLPYSVYGNRQDGTSVRGPSNSLTPGSIPLGAWRSVGGCESGFAVPEPDGSAVWSGCYDGALERWEAASGQARDVSVWPEAAESWPAEALRYRFQWTFPVALSPHDPGRVYVGSQVVHRSVDGGQSWQVISPDLTGDEEEWQGKSGGLTPDDAGPTIAPTVFAIAESPLVEGLLWAGTNDGRLHLSRDGGGSWLEVTKNLPGLPPWGTVSNVEPSRHAPGTAYVTVDRHQLGDFAPYVFKTADFGATWTAVTTGIPEDLLSYAHCVREDPVRPGLLYLGAENALYVSFDDGGRWLPLQGDLPHAPVHWLTVQEDFSDLVVATYGRGFWILDDVTPLRELAAGALEPGLHLFTPRPAYRFRMRQGAQQQPGDPAAGENPAYGATLHYLLESEAVGEVRLEVLDAAGEVIRTLGSLSGEPGLHRVTWDLAHRGNERARLLTRPDEHSHVAIPEEGSRRMTEWGRVAPLVAPGTYTLRLTVGEVERSRELTVLRDPASPAGDGEIRAQTAVLLELREEVGRVVAMIGEIESLRVQLADLAERLAGRPEAGEAVGAALELAKELRALEDTFFDLRLTPAGQDTLRWPRKLYARLLYLARAIGGSDHRPTDQQLEVHALLTARVAAAEGRLAELRDGPLAELNARLREEGVPHVMPLPPPPAPPAPEEPEERPY